jgi:hypothetical protein
MTYRPITALVALAIAALPGTFANAQTPQEVKTDKNKSLVLGNFLNAPSNCGTNPGPVPLPRLRERPAHGVVGLQIVVGDVAATDACPARKIPALAIFYTPAKDFVGKDSIQIEFEVADQKIPGLSFVITVQPGDQN